MASETLEGFDQSAHAGEVRQRWGERAWAESDSWWRGLGGQGQQTFVEEHRQFAARWARLRLEGAAIDGADAPGNPGATRLGCPGLGGAPPHSRRAGRAG